MRARVIGRRDVATLATAIGALYAALLLSIPGVPGVMPLWNWFRLEQIYALRCACALVVAGIVPYAVRYWRARAAKCAVEEGSVRVGLRTFYAANVTGFSVAPDGHGVSVAIGEGETTTFLELDTMDDARQIASALKRRFPADGELRLTLPSSFTWNTIRLVSFIALFGAAMLFLDLEDGFFGMYWVGSILLALPLAALVYACRQTAQKLSWGPATTREPARVRDGTAIARHVQRHEEARLTAPPAPPRVRVDLLAQGNDSVAAWIARIDALDAAGGYRGENAPAELLHETVRDDTAPVDVRLAAARILAVRDGEDRIRIADSVTDREIRARVLAITDEEPEEALAEIGPIFRARNR